MNPEIAKEAPEYILPKSKDDALIMQLEEELSRLMDFSKNPDEERYLMGWKDAVAFIKEIR